MEVMRKMTSRCLVLLVFGVFVLRDVCSTYEHIFPKGTPDKNILDMLLYRNRYDKRLKPTELTDVNVSVTLLSLSSPDESSLKYEVEFLLHQHWRDGRLKFTSDDNHSYLNAIDHQNDIWLPDTYFIKHGDFKDPLITANIELRVFADGSVRYTMRRHLILKCTGNLDIFPFDDPCCKFNIESTSHEKKYLVYNWTLPALKRSEDLHSLNAYMIGEKTLFCDKTNWRGNFSCLGVELNFTRDKSFYFSTVFIPGMLLVTSSFITFWLEWNAVPGRVMLGVTTMLNFFTMSNNFRSNLPVVSNLTAMNVWDGVCMCFIYASLLEFVTVNYLHFYVRICCAEDDNQQLTFTIHCLGLARKKPRSARLAAAAATATATATATALSASQSNTAMLKREPGLSEVSNNPPSVQAPPNSHSSAGDSAMNKLVTGREFPPPIRIAKMIDVVSRVVFPIAYGIFLIFFFVRYKWF